ncbi:MAG TPA: hypothetical protein VK204_00435 [Nocardioidaceae bacterium]|nr:hypothetical protein [Nocardioidaceae bacterium]
MGEGSRERKQISTAVAVIMLIVIGAAVVYLGVTLILFGVYALGEDSTLIGLATLVLGVIFVAGPVVVLASQVRAMLRRHG